MRQSTLRNGILARTEERNKQLCPNGIDESRVRRNKREKQKRIAAYHAKKEMEIRRKAQAMTTPPLPSAPYAPTAIQLVEDATMVVCMTASGSTDFKEQRLKNNGSQIMGSGGNDYHVQVENEDDVDGGDDSDYEEEEQEQVEEKYSRTAAMSCCGYSGVIAAAFAGAFVAVIVVS